MSNAAGFRIPLPMITLIRLTWASQYCISAAIIAVSVSFRETVMYHVQEDGSRRLGNSQSDTVGADACVRNLNEARSIL